MPQQKNTAPRRDRAREELQKADEQYRQYMETRIPFWPFFRPPPPPYYPPRTGNPLPGKTGKK